MLFFSVVIGTKQIVVFFPVLIFALKILQGLKNTLRDQQSTAASIGFPVFGEGWLAPCIDNDPQQTVDQRRKAPRIRTL